jgi:hypothetical protein
MVLLFFEGMDEASERSRLALPTCRWTGMLSCKQAIAVPEKQLLKTSSRSNNDLDRDFVEKLESVIDRLKSARSIMSLPLSYTRTK